MEKNRIHGNLVVREVGRTPDDSGSTGSSLSGDAVVFSVEGASQFVGRLHASVPLDAQNGSASALGMVGLVQTKHLSTNRLCYFVGNTRCDDAL